MPEAAVDKNGHLRSRKDNVDGTSLRLQQTLVQSESQSALVKLRSDQSFTRVAAPPCYGHSLGGNRRDRVNE